jgi:hypothetical protein
MDDTTIPQTQSVPKRIYFGIGTKITLLLGTAVLLASSAIGLATYRHFDDALVRRKISDLNAFARVKAADVVREVGGLSDDVRFFANISAIREWIRAREENRSDALDPAIEHRLRVQLETTFSAIMRTKPEYYKIRFIGIADGGREIVRVERSVKTGELRIVPADELQQKEKEPFFQASIHTAPDQVYLSDINLNHEHGSVQIPYTPVLRASVPVYDAEGVAFGFVVINRLANALFDSLNENV